MTKKYVLDTSVILSDPHCLENFPNSTIIIQEGVLAELDRAKTDLGEMGKNARVFIRQLDEISGKGNISKGFKFKTNTLIKIDTKVYTSEQFGDPTYVDNKILQCAMNEKGSTIISRDISLRLRARAFGCNAIDYQSSSRNISDLYQGFRVSQDAQLGEKLKRNQELDCNLFESLRDLRPNECIHFVNDKGKTVSLGREIDGVLEFIPGARPWGLDARNIEQAMAINLLLDPVVPLVSLAGMAGCGKAQPLTAKILTPNGFVTMGSIKPNDYVIGSDGQPKKVISIHPQGIKKIYKVTFSDGSSTECCEDHLWFTKTSLDRDYGRKGSVKSLKEIKETINYGKHKKTNHSIPLIKKVQFNKKEVPIKPYLLGALLGDGGLSHGICLSSQDAEIIKRCRKELPQGIKLIKKNNSKYDYAISKGFKSNKKNILLEHLRDLGLAGLKSEQKFVPHIYKINDPEIRLQVLQGLMDTDGSVEQNGYANIFYTCSPQLAEDVKFLAESLGCKVTKRTKQTSYTHLGNKKQGKLCYALSISPPSDVDLFYLSRKKDKSKKRTRYLPTRYIKNIEYVGEKKSQCIYINSNDHLYATDNFILTHNTLISVAAALEMVIKTNVYDRIIIYRPIQPVGTDLGYLPGELAEKLEPWMGAIKDSMDLLASSSSKKYKKKNGRPETWQDNFSPFLDRIQLESLTHIRGRSIPNSFIIMDESQNVSKKDIKTLVTRMGENSKLVLTGDIQQIDHHKLDAIDNGLTSIINCFKDDPLAGHITLTKGERSALATRAAELL